MAEGQEIQNIPLHDSSNEEDFELACSDEEMAMKDGVEWEPKPEEIVELFEALDQNKILHLDWQCPERRPLTPVDNFEQRYVVDANAECLEDKSGFDFEDESSPMKMSVRPAGSEIGPRGGNRQRQKRRGVKRKVYFRLHQKH